MNKSCIFCKILAKEIPGDIIAENEDVFVIKDIYPQAPIHYLIIPKKHIVGVSAFTPDDAPLAASLLLMAKQLSESDARLDQFKLITNNGPLAGQVVFHLHVHFLSGF